MNRLLPTLLSVALGLGAFRDSLGPVGARRVRGRPVRNVLNQRHGDGLGSGRTPVRLPAGRGASRDQGRDPAEHPLPYHHRDRLRRRARTARDRVRPGLPSEQLCVHLLHEDGTGHPQRRSAPGGQFDRLRHVPDGTETAIVDLDNLSTLTNHNGGAMHFRDRRQALRRRRRERELRQRAESLESSRQDPSLQSGRDHSRRQSDDVLERRGIDVGAEQGDLGPGPAESLHVRVSARHRPGCSSTTSARTPGSRSTTGSPVSITDGRAARPTASATSPE